MNNKIETYIGFAIKANDILKGLDNILKLKKKVELIIVLDSQLSKNTLDRLHKINLTDDIDVINYFSETNTLSGIKIIGITNKNIKDAILKNIDKSNIWRKEI